MTLSAIVSRYAEALADVVTAPASATRGEQAVAELQEFASALESAELRNALISPSVPSSRKRAVVAKIADVLRLSRISRNFLFVLIDHRRIAELPHIIEALELILDERMGFARAEVAAARDLSEVQRQAINSRLEDLTGKRIRVRFTVDQALIGGLVARIGSTVYDGSLRGQLNTLGRRLSAEE